MKSSSAFFASGPLSFPVSYSMNRSMTLSNLSSSDSVVAFKLGANGCGFGVVVGDAGVDGVAGLSSGLAATSSTADRVRVSMAELPNSRRLGLQ